ncbi:DUF1349 domain-containing protein [Kineosporia babensis]|uniref:DUF1349 domain-containing protein n=1 Tax=Kineosporia babensis TaxID=499548 RepID=A0A9X1NMI4_9ACTN|nr:DUF1349 domain-containing protein [Kineosporia babensis]MCD5316471.1 DUF1349 domain-containing protein [Kineosporia babensis]
MTSTRVPGLPFDLTPSPGSSWDVTGATLSTTAHPKSDIFVDPAGTAVTLASAALHNAATLLTDAPAGDFQFSARVGVDFGTTFDAGVLLVRVDETHWAKLCFEYSPAGEPMVVSVVCRGVADDANAFVVEQRTVWLRVSRIGETFGFHASVDGRVWQLIRYFTLGTVGRPFEFGFEAQSPMGEGCAVRFDEVSYRPQKLADLRDGS